MRLGVLKKKRPETREAARPASRRVRQETIEDEFEEAELESDLFDDDAVHERLDELTRKIDRLTSKGPAAYAPLRQRATGDSHDELAEMVARLDRRLDQFVSVAHAMPSVVKRPQSRGISPAVAEITARQRMLRGEPVPAPAPAPRLQQRPQQTRQPQAAHVTTPVDAQYSHAAGYATPQPAPHAAQQIAQPLAPQAPLPTQDISRLEQQLRSITNQIETLRKPGVEEAIHALRSELSQIAQTLTDAMPRHVIDAIDAQIQSLAQRLSEGRQAGVSGEVLTSIEQHLGDIHNALRSLTPAENLDGFNETVQALASRIDLIVAQKDPASFAQLEEAIGNLRAVSAHVASNEAVHELAAQVQALTAKVDQIAYTSSGDAALSHIEQRIAALSDAIATRNNNGGGVPHHLEKLVGSLADKIEQLQVSRGDGITGHLEERIVKLAEKLDASDSRLGNLEAVERGLGELLAQTERLTRNAPAAAPGAANEHVDALRHDVARTQDSLESVHSTLAILVDRLAAIEKGIRERPAAAPTQHLPPAPMLKQPVEAVVAQVVAAAAQMQAQHPVAAPSPVAQAPVAQVPVAQAPAAQPAPVQVSNAKKPALPPRRSQPIDPDLPPDHPIEPGMARPAAGRAQNISVAAPSPAARIAASEAALSGNRPPVIPDPAGQSNFIAAARRAAKIAEQDPGPPIPVPPRAEVSYDAEAPRTSLGSALAARVKSLLIASSVVAIVVGGYYIVGSMLDGDAPPATTAPAKPETIAPTSGETPADAPAENNSGFKLLAPDSAMQGVPGASPAPAKPETNPDVTNSIGKRSAYPEKLPAAFSATLRDAAINGDATAAYEVATRYADGQGVAASLEEAARWFERAAQGGLAPAQFRLGSLYEKGQGVHRDLKNARRLYVAAAEQGNAKAMHNLAVLYAEGIDGRQDYKTAGQWFQKAAAYGVPDSQYNLAILYARGLGIEKSLPEAYKWFSLAAAQGDKESAKKRDEVGARLDPAARTIAENAVKTFVPQIQPQQAVRVPSPPNGWDKATETDASTARPAVRPIRLGAR
jgi:localization factor PodJL